MKGYILGTGTAGLFSRAHLHWNGRQISDTLCQTPTLLYSPLFSNLVEHLMQKESIRILSINNHKLI